LRSGSISHRPAKRVVNRRQFDERSLNELGQWPWRRDVNIGKLVTRLRDMVAAS
jgi:CHASE2 domain-containing sensor protein